MKYSDFEKHIGKKLADAEAPVNMELLLDQLGLVEPSKEKKVRPFPFWILIPIVVLGSIFTFMTLKGNKDAVDENPLKYLSNAEIIQQLKKNKNPIAKIITTQTEALDKTTICSNCSIRRGEHKK